MMKKTIQIGGLVCALALHASAVEFFVETTGDDLNAGTAEAPFQTLEKAQLAVRAALPTATEPIQVWVGGGTYYLDQALEFGPADSGSASVPVTYAGMPNETVVISGAIPLTPTWSTYSGNILVADIGTGLSFDVLFADSEQQVLARYPNYSEETVILNGYASDAISRSRVASWSDPSTGLVRGLHSKKWGGTSFKITGVESDGDPRLEWVGDNNRGSGMHSSYRMVENIFEELDAPGEWFYDEAAGLLYFYPPAGLNAATATFEAASAEELIRVVGDGSTKVGYLTFDNFTFTQTRRTLFTREYERPLRSDWGIARAGAIYLDHAENVTISNSIFDHLGGNAVFSSGYNRNHLITENEFTNIGATCVQFVGLVSAVRYPSFWDNDDHKTDIQDITPGPLTDDYPKNCTVSYNHMQDMGRFEKQTCGVNLSMSESITVSHNTIHGSPRSGINICDGTWGGHLIEFNDVFDCVRETEDHGPFNAWGRDRFWSYLGFNTTGSEGAAKKPYAFLDAWKTTVIRNNRFHYDEPSRFGIDLDDGSTNYELYNNLILNASIKLREGFGRKAYNNIMINQPAEFHVWYDGCGDIFTNNIILNGKAYNSVQVNIANSEATIDYNLFYNAGEPVSVAFSGATDTHSLTANPLFINPESNDYSVAANSPAIGLGFVNFPMDQFGKPGAPEPGAIEIDTDPDAAADTEPLMGAVACSIYDEGVQSALGAPDFNGVYLETVPAYSYAEGQGFKTGDVIRSINGETITDKQSFWLLYHLIEPGTEVAMTYLRNQIEQPGSFTKVAYAEELNDTAGVVYSEGWSTQENAEAFNGDLQFNRTAGAYFELTFYGVGIEFTSRLHDDMGNIEVYIDGVLDETVSCYSSSVQYQQTVYQNTNLTAGEHTLKVVNAEDKYMILDSVSVYGAPIEVLPEIVYTASGSAETEVPGVSTDDLAQTQYLSSSATGGEGVATDHANLFNGSVDEETYVTMNSDNTFTITFDTSFNTLGYDITGIDSVFGWSTGNRGRSNQGYEITVTFVDGSKAVLAGPEHWAPNSPASYWTTVSFRETSGGVMASGVRSITFDITEDANAGGVVVGREIDIFGVPTEVGPVTVLSGIVYTTAQSSDAVPAVSDVDLAQTQYESSTASSEEEAAADHAELFNGSVGNDDGDTADPGEVTMGIGDSVMLTLDTSVNTNGYDLSGIDSVFGWSTSNGGRANQGYQVTVVLVDGSKAILAEAEHWAPNLAPTTYWTTVSFREEEGGVMVSGVKSIIFEITEEANAGGVVVGREIDIFGVPTQEGAVHAPMFEPEMTVSNGNMMLGFSGTVGQHYRVESIDDLISSNSWQVVTDLVSLAVSPVAVSAPMTNSAAFYRVIWQP
ncbi:right-handed parallel beta-helix repeat-containing protein [Pontiellaceae bacterium B12219]|nr:right-handed parallel beta-helix repeat-containing protein [Pontiellaceae bacterium B12219]